jgi:hypothetical protein
VENPVRRPVDSRRHNVIGVADREGETDACFSTQEPLNRSPCQESPRWLASVGRTEDAIANLAYLRREPENSETVIHEMAEIEAQIQEEREARQGLGLREAFLGKGNFIRFGRSILISTKHNIHQTSHRVCYFPVATVVWTKFCQVCFLCLFPTSMKLKTFI